MSKDLSEFKIQSDKEIHEKTWEDVGLKLVEYFDEIGSAKPELGESRADFNSRMTKQVKRMVGDFSKYEENYRRVGVRLSLICDKNRNIVAQFDLANGKDLINYIDFLLLRAEDKDSPSILEKFWGVYDLLNELMNNLYSEYDFSNSEDAHYLMGWLPAIADKFFKLYKEINFKNNKVLLLVFKMNECAEKIQKKELVEYIEGLRLKAKR